jgi:peptidoglycan/LPS O-acetylase OafA/YrhL
MALLAAALGQSFLIYMGLWLIGVGIAFVSAPALERPISALLFLVFVLVLTRLAKNALGHRELIMAGNYCVACSFAWLLLSMRHARFGWLEKWRRLNALMSSFSYSLYLIHFPLMLVILGALYATGRFEGIARGYSPTDARGLLAYAIVAGAVGLCAFAFAQLTERQTPRLRRFLKRSFGERLNPVTLRDS